MDDHDWKCAGCGKLSPNCIRVCDCPTAVVYKTGGRSAWKIDPTSKNAEIARLTAEVERGYDATQEEINDLRHALAQIGQSAPQSNEALGIEYIRYAKMVIRHEARRFQQRPQQEKA